MYLMVFFFSTKKNSSIVSMVLFSLQISFSKKPLPLEHSKSYPEYVTIFLMKRRIPFLNLMKTCEIFFEMKGLLR